MIASARLSFDWRRQPVQAGILITLALTPVWYRFRGAPGSFDMLYSSGFLIFWPMLATVVWWLAAGLPGFALLRRDPTRRLWALALLLLALWALLSQIWGYTRSFQPDVTLGAALPFTLAALFALVCACAAPPPRAIASGLLLSFTISALIGGLQVAAQRSLGLRALGEFVLNPAVSGVSIVQADGVRWLRPYGLLPHPNVLAGFLLVGLFAALAWALRRDRRLMLAGTLALFGGLWVFLLTFSRGAWLGFTVGLFAALPLIWRAAPRQRARLIAFAGFSLVLGGLFIALYGPFVAARAGAGEESIELRSAADRAVYADFALRAVDESPLVGLGMGNFAWRASAYLQATAFDLRGQPVHHIYLLAFAELGLIGLLLLSAALALGVEAALQTCRARRDVSRAALTGAVIALAFVGLFDHYPWTLLQFQALWWGLLAALGQPDAPPVTGTSGSRTLPGQH